MNIVFQYIIFSILYGVVTTLSIDSLLCTLFIDNHTYNTLLSLSFYLSSLIAFTFFFRNEVRGMIKGMV